MKHALALPLALFLSSIPLHGDVVFEQTAEVPGAKHTATFKFKGDRVRLDSVSPNANVTTFIDRTGTIVAYEHNMKIVMKSTMSKAKDAAKGLLAKAEKEHAKATGETETVGDWNCQIWTRETPAGLEKQWRTKEIPNFNRIQEYLEKFASDSGLEGHFSPEGIAVKVETTGPTGKTTLTTVKLAEEPVPDSTFTAPEGYREILPPSKQPSTSESTPHSSPK